MHMPTMEGFVTNILRNITFLFYTHTRQVLFIIAFIFMAGFLMQQQMLQINVYGDQQNVNIFNWERIPGAKEMFAAVGKRLRYKDTYRHKTDKKENPELVESSTRLTTLPFDVRIDWSENKKSLAIFILSAIGYNFTTASGYKHEITLHGWQGYKHYNVKIKCCVLWNTNKTTEYIYPNETTRGKSYVLTATSFSCPVRGSLTAIKGISLQFARAKCPADKKTYMKPFIPKFQTKNNSFAICLKIIYGNVDSRLLIDWIEFYIEMKVDKIFMFVYNLTQEAQSIIRHYVKVGILETRKFDFPWKNNRTVGMKNPQVWQDEQVVVYDCYHRLHSYNFVTIVDLDEFLLPRKHVNIKDMMKYQMAENPKAAGFALKMFIFNKSWNTTRRVSGSDIVRYIQRTHALVGMKSRTKNIIIPRRVCLDEHFYTHAFKPKPGYESYTMPESIGAINHYRSCYPNLPNFCNKRRRIVDTSILKVVERFKNRTTWFQSSRKV